MELPFNKDSFLLPSDIHATSPFNINTNTPNHSYKIFNENERDLENDSDTLEPSKKVKVSSYGFKAPSVNSSQRASQALVNEASVNLPQHLNKMSYGRQEYAAFFGEMYDNLLQCWSEQLQFLQTLKEVNESVDHPLIDKINPMIANTLMQKSTLDGNALRAMKKAEKAMKAGNLINKSQSAQTTNGKRRYESLESFSMSQKSTSNTK